MTTSRRRSRSRSCPGGTRQGSTSIPFAGPGVTVTATVRLTPPEATERVPDPAENPPDRTAVGDPIPVGVTEPRVVAHDTLRPETSFPYRSRPAAFRSSVPPAATVIGDGVTSSASRAAGAISTIEVPVFGPDCAVTVPVPTIVEAVNRPAESIVPIPPLTPQVNPAPEIVFPKRSLACAVNVLVVPATMLATPGRTST